MSTINTEASMDEARIADLINALYRLANQYTSDWQADKTIWEAVRRELGSRTYADIVMAKAQLEAK